jgi:hypothetical protein
VHAHWFRVFLATQLAGNVLEISDQFLLFGVYRDRWLAHGDRCLHDLVDMRELGIAVRVVAALPRLARRRAWIALRRSVAFACASFARKP